MRLLHPRLWIAALVLTTLFGAGLAPSATAQEATPTAAECTGPGADTEHLLGLWFDADHNLMATPEVPGLQAVTGPEVTLQMGKPANAATITGVTETVTAVFNCFVAGDFAGARRIHQELLPLMQINFIESSPIPVKAAMAMMGLLDEIYRLPLVPPRPASRERIAQVLRDLGLPIGPATVRA